MKIVKNTSTFLILQNRQSFIFILVFSLIFSLVGLLILKWQPMPQIINHHTETKSDYVQIGFGILFILISILILSVFPLITCVFDKLSRLVTIKQQSLLETKVIKPSIDDILAVELEDNNEYLYRITLLLISGQCLPLSDSYDNIDVKNKQKAVNCIKNFLNL